MIINLSVGENNRLAHTHSSVRGPPEVAEPIPARRHGAQPGVLRRGPVRPELLLALLPPPVRVICRVRVRVRVRAGHKRHLVECAVVF